jgi:hypothetical protein
MHEGCDELWRDGYRVGQYWTWERISDRTRMRGGVYYGIKLTAVPGPAW